MCPIKGLSEQRRLPRKGKIHLGVKKVNANNVEYPSPTKYFVCPDEVKKVYGDKPTKLDIIIPVEDEEMWASQYYRQYSRTRGLVCKGDGITCRRMIDKGSGDIAGKGTKEVVWKEGLTCEGRSCPDYQARKCQEVMNLQFLLPKVPGIGIWQIDTGSINSIRNINSCAAMIRAVCERVSWIPLTLSLEPVDVTNPEDGKKKVVHCLNMRHESSLQELLAASGKPKVELLITTPAEDEAPMDKTENGDVIEVEGEVKVTPAQSSQNGTTSEEEWGKMKREESSEQATQPQEAKREENTDLASLEFKNPGEFYTACLKHFNLNKSQADKEVPEYDLTKANQRKQAWQQIVAVYRKKGD